MFSFFLPLTHTPRCAHVSFLLCRVYKNLTCLLSATEAPCVPPPEWPTHPVTMGGRRSGGGMTGDNGSEREKNGGWGGMRCRGKDLGGVGGWVVVGGWVGALKLPLMCPLHSLPVTSELLTARKC
ncbi:hypothetical protein CgunFtcFv8_013256 [Champsocephalus gunnari]|uniref:Uncharacterized protein n=1 Tax=Champsocephalus gunnari TaxID=52237 RepID=A0AAN8DT10_CHAGU|nr:hypothetical protein CgunFtcFv8_013256 [Champsocephalus gunnari]